MSRICPTSCKEAILLISLLALAFSSIVCASNARSETVLRIEPTSSYTARGPGLLVGGTERNGTVWKSSFLEIKEGTGDRAIVEFDLRGQSPAAHVTLDFQMANIDDPDYTNIFLYSFEANGLAEPQDFNQLGNLVMTFTDHGLSDSFEPYSFDVTEIYNQAIDEDYEYLGFLWRNRTDEPLYARYRLANSPVSPLPTLVILPVPEPSTCIIAATGFALLIQWRRCSPWKTW